MGADSPAAMRHAVVPECASVVGRREARDSGLFESQTARYRHFLWRRAVVGADCRRVPTPRWSTRRSLASLAGGADRSCPRHSVANGM